MSNLAFLEDFQSAPIRKPSPEELAKSADFDAGYAQGLADAEAAQAGSVQELATLLNEYCFGHAEARQTLLAELGPFFAAIVQKVLPEIVDATIKDSIVAALSEAADRATGQPMQLNVPPDLVETAAAAAACLAGEQIDIVANANLAGRRVMISADGADTSLDLDPLLQEIAAITRAVQDVTTGTENHG